VSPTDPSERAYLYVCPDCETENWFCGTRLSKDLVPVVCEECGRRLGEDDRVHGAGWRSG
jgi:DNA-directed RNA polymerase subunit RPC12/RpoP